VRLETIESDQLLEKIQLLFEQEAALKQKMSAFSMLQVERSAKLKEAVHSPFSPISLKNLFLLHRLKSAVKRYVRN
jgi:hypothetical protein